MTKQAPPRRAFLLLARLSALGLFALLAGGPVSHGQQEGDVVEITLTQTDREGQPYAFEPDEVVVKPGTTVRWVWDHDTFHSVTSTNSSQQLRPNGLWDESHSSEGSTVEYTFEENGIYHYYCKPHANFMTGTVIVGEQSDSPGAEALLVVIVAVLGLVPALRAFRGREGTLGAHESSGIRWIDISSAKRGPDDP